MSYVDFKLKMALSYQPKHRSFTVTLSPLLNRLQPIGPLRSKNAMFIVFPFKMKKKRPNQNEMMGKYTCCKQKLMDRIGYSKRSEM